MGGFVLQGLLGRGAFGEVYAAQEPGSGRPVALKLLKRSGERELKRFEREAEALSRLDHPGVVKIQMNMRKGSLPNRRHSRNPSSRAEAYL